MLLRFGLSIGFLFCLTVTSTGQDLPIPDSVLTPMRERDCYVDNFGYGVCREWSNLQTGSQFLVFCDLDGCFWQRTIHADGTITEMLLNQVDA